MNKKQKDPIRSTISEILGSGPNKSSSESAEEVTVSSAEKVYKDPTVTSPHVDTNGGDFLGSLLHARIFFDYFEYVANKTYRGSNTELKVVKLKSVHPNIHITCLILDILIAVAALVLLSILAFSAVWKIIWG